MSYIDYSIHTVSNNNHYSDNSNNHYSDNDIIIVLAHLYNY